MQISNCSVIAKHPEIDHSKERKSIIGSINQFHLFHTLFIFGLISFDDMTLVEEK
jgi:hypothetical protein